MSDEWMLRTGDGQEFGPISKRELDTWVIEGRVTAACWVMRSGGSEWQWASAVYPVLVETVDAVVERACPYCAETILDSAIKCKHCGSLLSGQVPGQTEFPTSNRYDSQPSHSRDQHQRYISYNGVTVPVVISGVFNLMVGLSLTASSLFLCFPVIFGIPLLILGMFEIAFASRASGMRPREVAAEARTLGVFEIVIGLFNWITLFCGIFTLVGASSLEREALRR